MLNIGKLCLIFTCSLTLHVQVHWRFKYLSEDALTYNCVCFLVCYAGSANDLLLFSWRSPTFNARLILKSQRRHLAQYWMRLKHTSCCCLYICLVVSHECMNRHMLGQQALAAEGLATNSAGVGGGAGAGLGKGMVKEKYWGTKRKYLLTSQVFLWCFNLASTMQPRPQNSPG